LTSIVRVSAPASPLVLGSSGQLEGRQFRIVKHALVTIAEVGRVYDRHEYHLTTETGDAALLVCGSKFGKPEWVFFVPFDPETPLRPFEAAAKGVKDTVRFNDDFCRVTEVFQSTVRQIESVNSEVPAKAEVLYGWTALSGTTRFLVEWSHDRIVFYRGKILQNKDVTDRFVARAK
jgi:hypothetical protein